MAGIGSGLRTLASGQFDANAATDRLERTERRTYGTTTPDPIENGDLRAAKQLHRAKLHAGTDGDPLPRAQTPAGRQRESGFSPETPGKRRQIPESPVRHESS
jgi:hypothetical protein